MTDPYKSNRRVDSVDGSNRGSRVRPRADKTLETSHAGAAHGSYSINLLMLRRAAERCNKQRRDLSEGIEVRVVPSASRFAMELVRTSDSAVIHRSRDIPFASVSSTSVNAILKSFLNNESLKRFE